jgi:hypothetical protein
MKIKVISVLFIISLFSISCTELEEVLEDTGLSELEVVEGLKSALTVGTDTSVTVLSAVNGYLGDDLVKIILPDEASAIVTNIAKVPGGNLLIEKTIEAI